MMSQCCGAGSTLRVVVAVMAFGLLTAGSAVSVAQEVAQAQEVAKTPEILSVPELRVWAGETFRVTPARRNMEVERWIMEDGSTILIEPGVEDWTIRAKEARFGSETKLLGVGSDGRENGARGENGVTLKITMGLFENDGLQIDVRGGNGMNGSKGATGRRGRQSTCVPPRKYPGGPGGPGGRGGDGGNGGAVVIRYSILYDPAQEIAEIHVNNAGGQPGAGGEGGDGPRGARGPRGEIGRPGRPGETRTEAVDPAEIGR